MLILSAAPALATPWATAKTISDTRSAATGTIATRALSGLCVVPRSNYSPERGRTARALCTAASVRGSWHTAR